MERVDVIENERIVEVAVEGMPVGAAVYFEAQDAGTEVTLRLGYALPGLCAYVCQPLVCITLALQVSLQLSQHISTPL